MGLTQIIIGTTLACIAFFAIMYFMFNLQNKSLVKAQAIIDDIEPRINKATTKAEVIDLYDELKDKTLDKEGYFIVTSLPLEIKRLFSILYGKLDLLDALEQTKGREQFYKLADIKKALYVGVEIGVANHVPEHRDEAGDITNMNKKYEFEIESYLESLKINNN